MRFLVKHEALCFQLHFIPSLAPFLSVILPFHFTVNSNYLGMLLYGLR